MYKKLTTRDAFMIGLISQILIMILGASVLAQTPQLDAKSQEMKNKITSIGTGSDLTIKDKSGQEFYGLVAEIKNDAVSISEVDLKKTVEIRYDDIKSVDKGYGQRKGFNGKRISPHKRLIGVIVASSLVLIPIIIVASVKD